MHLVWATISSVDSIAYLACDLLEELHKTWVLQRGSSLDCRQEI